MAFEPLGSATRAPTADALQRAIERGESDILEFQVGLPSDTEVAKTLVAFANSRGGVLLVGVANDGAVVGLSVTEAEQALKRIRSVAANILPTPATTDVQTIRGRAVVYAMVDPAPAHARPVLTASGESYIRTGVADVAVQPPQLAALEAPATLTGSVMGPAVRVFVAMSFRTEEEPALVDYWKAMERAVARTGLPLKLIRIDLQEGDYEISQKIMDEIDTCPIIVADFTLSPHNVYFELGYARGCKGKQIIQTARKDVILEFDVRNWRTAFYNNATELEEKLVQALPTAYSRVQAQ
jgi:hypothetical protein